MESARKYKSKFGADTDITSAQFLTEMIVERIAKKEKKTLTVKFWNSPEWNRIFRTQIVHANKLLAKYSCLEIANALKTKRGLSIYSLGNKKPIEAIIESSKKIQGLSAKIISVDEGENIFDVDLADVKPANEVVTNKKNLWSLLGE